MNRRLLLALCPLIFFTTGFGQSPATSAVAATTSSPHFGAFATTSPLLRVLDFNRDRILAGSEIGQAAILLTALDLNEDGTLDGEELGAFSARGTSDGIATVASLSAGDLNVLLHLDANHDGILQPIEVANASSSLRRLDTNGDGVVTRDELRRERTAVYAAASTR